MSKRNLLLGHGEALTSASTIKRGSGKKRYPYDLVETRKALYEPLNDVINSLAHLNESAKPRGEGVFELTLHPAFMARTYFPKSVLRVSGLRDVGSKQSIIVPRKSLKKSDSDKPQATATLFLAGNIQAVKELTEMLTSDGATDRIKNELREIESISWVNGLQKIVGDIPTDGATHSFEVALHAGPSEEDIVASFHAFSRNHGAKVDLSRKIRVGGLTFVPVMATADSIKEISNFSFLRVARLMPILRMDIPDSVRQTISVKTPSLPSSKSIDLSQRVAIFDGGLGTTDLAKWSEEIIYDDTQETNGQLLMHGNEVTSTFLFGRHKDAEDPLSPPFMNVDHYRVLSPVSGRDPDLFDVLHRIKAALETGEYKFANLSLGPRMPICDEEVHAWTATLDQLCATHGILTTVAVGNDGEYAGANRIQPPGDMVNALAIGAADSCGSKWKRAAYSCIGPGRSPGYVKPDGVAFGGTKKEPFTVFNPLIGGIVGVQGTSYSSPLALRTAAGIAASTSYPMTAIALKALLVHSADKRKSLKREEIGWGRFREDPMAILECESETATIIFQGTLAKGQYRRCPIPMPNISLSGGVEIKATLCIQAHTDPEHAVNYTRSGMGVTFRPRNGVGDSATTGFFGRATQYKASEREHRDDAHKWETCLHRVRNFTAPVDLADPVFDIEYHARQNSRGVPAKSAPDVRYALVISVRADGVNNIYDLIRQRYEVLMPVTLRANIELDAS